MTDAPDGLAALADTLCTLPALDHATLTFVRSLPERPEVWRSLAQLGSKLRIGWSIDVWPPASAPEDLQDSRVTEQLFAIPAAADLRLQLFDFPTPRSSTQLWMAWTACPACAGWSITRGIDRSLWPCRGSCGAASS